MYYRRRCLAEKSEERVRAGSQQLATFLSAMDDDYEPVLYWESAYAIALALIEHYPERRPEEVGLEELAALVMALPAFRDDPAFATERILLDLQFAWYEETTNL